MMILEHNIKTNEVIERDPTADELAQIVVDEAVWAAELAELEAAKAEAEAKRQTLLDKLGITADEAKLLLG